MKRLVLSAAVVAIGLSTIRNGSADAASLGRPAFHRNLTGSTAWVNTHTLAVAPFLKNATAVGNLAGSTPMHIAVALPMQHASEVMNVLYHESTRGDAMFQHYLTPQQFNNYFAPTSAQVAAVTNYLSASGLTHVSVEANALYVTADGTAANVARAFNTSFGTYRMNGGLEFANTAPAQVPAALSGDVLSVLGLTSLGRMHTFYHVRGAASTVALAKKRAGRTLASHGQHRMETCGTPDPVLGTCGAASTYNTRDLSQIYHEYSVPVANQTKLAIFAEGDLTQMLKDYTTFNNKFAVYSTTTPINIIPVGISSPDVSGLGEWDLDTQSSSSMAGVAAALDVYDAASLTDPDVGVSFNRFATRDVEQAGSASFGECETQAYIDGFTVAADQSLSQAAMQGQTVFSSAGDNGSFCGVVIALGAPSGLPEQAYPAASPYIVAAGGTALLPNNESSSPTATYNAYNTEISWIAGGGGISVHESGGFWQSGVVPAAINPPPLATPVTGPDQIQGPQERAVPDVAMNADPNISALEIIAYGQSSFVGGTSESSPLWLGSWGRLESAFSNKLGFASPVLYNTYKVDLTGAVPQPGVTTQEVGGFHDILLGGNGIYTAQPRWDFTTGLGSPDMPVLGRLLAKILYG